MTAETRRKVILDESNRIRQLNAYMLFTLPIELMKERQKLGQFAFVETFPFVKLIERNGQRRPESIEKFREFVYRRIDKSLFENEALVDEAICYGGGSPRELLKILKTANVVADRAQGVITRTALDKALHRLANQTAQFLSPVQWATIKSVVQNNRERRGTPFDDTLQDLLERLILMEYNDGNYKRPNPILELSDAYRENIGTPA